MTLEQCFLLDEFFCFRTKLLPNNFVGWINVRWRLSHPIRHCHPADFVHVIRNDVTFNGAQRGNMFLFRSRLFFVKTQTAFYVSTPDIWWTHQVWVDKSYNTFDWINIRNWIQQISKQKKRREPHYHSVIDTKNN